MDEIKKLSEPEYATILINRGYHSLLIIRGGRQQTYPITKAVAKNLISLGFSYKMINEG